VLEFHVLAAIEMARAGVAPRCRIVHRRPACPRQPSRGGAGGDHMAKRLVDRQKQEIREQMFLHEPTDPQWLSLNLTPEEKEKAVNLVLYLWLEYLPKNFWCVDLVFGDRWCSASKKRAQAKMVWH
jgi:hypothetical protein